MEYLEEFFIRLGRLFYIVNPATSSFSTIQEIPKYVVEASTFFTLFIFVERLILYARGERWHVKDSVTSVSAGLVQQVTKMFLLGLEHFAYFYIYENWGKDNLVLPWDSTWTWILAAVGVDLGYYWAHRAGHGANKYCLDKNYAGVLIIWDRMFGTFQREKKDDRPVYGLVTPLQSFNPVTVQTFYYKDIFEKALKMDNWKDKLSAIFKGPGWSKGTGWLGDPSTFPDVVPREKFDVKIPVWQTYYGLIHFLTMLLAYTIMAENVEVLTVVQILACSFYILFSLTSIGFIYDNHPAGPVLEVVRSTAFLLLTTGDFFGVQANMMSVLRIYFFLSALIWAVVIQRNLTFSEKKAI